MATSWVLGKISDALQPTIHSTVSSAGAFAGGALNTVGAGISGVGESINGTIKRYGDGVRDYGNGVMDWSSASGSRAQTASNPLGLSTGPSQGKRSVTSPSIYSATPKTNTKKAPTTPNKPGQSQKAAQTTSTKKPNLGGKTIPPAKKTSAVTSKANTVAKPAQGVKGLNRGTAQKTIKSPSSSALKQTSPVKVNAVSAKTNQPRSGPKVNHVAGANPLGLK